MKKPSDNPAILIPGTEDDERITRTKALIEASMRLEKPTREQTVPSRGAEVMVERRRKWAQ